MTDNRSSTPESRNAPQTQKSGRSASFYIEWTARIVSAAILLQTLRFKFTAAPESVHIFTTVGMEPWGRIGSGVAELIAGILLLVPAARWASLGAAMSMGIISGAIFFHLTKLGIEVLGDGGALFGAAVAVFVLSGVVLFCTRQGLLSWIRRDTGNIPG